MTLSELVVFDCNVYFQAFISVTGPAAKLFEAVNQKKLSLFLSEFVLDELRDVLARPRIVTKFKFTRERFTEYLATLVELATVVADVPHVFEFPRDPKDAHYVDLALAVHAKLVVSRDKDLLSLRDSTTIEGRDFLTRFPAANTVTYNHFEHGCYLRRSHSQDNQRVDPSGSILRKLARD